MMPSNSKVADIKVEEQAAVSSPESTTVIKRKHIDISIIIAVLSLAISALSFLFATFPQLNPFNSNIIEKANAGDLTSQIMLAEHYYEILDTAESIYWYKIASAQESAYQAKALNNLAYIYANVDSLNEWDSFTLVKAYKIFLKAGEMGETSAYRNAYILLHEIPAEILNKYKYDLEREKNKLQEFLSQSGNFSDDLKSIGFTFEFVTQTDNISEYKKDDYKIIPTKQAILRKKTDENAVGVPVIWTLYDVYRIIGEVDLPEYTYLHISQEETF